MVRYCNTKEEGAQFPPYTKPDSMAPALLLCLSASFWLCLFFPPARLASFFPFLSFSLFPFFFFLPFSLLYYIRFFALSLLLRRCCRWRPPPSLHVNGHNNRYSPVAHPISLHLKHQHWLRFKRLLFLSLARSLQHPTTLVLSGIWLIAIFSFPLVLNFC